MRGYLVTATLGLGVGIAVGLARAASTGNFDIADGLFDVGFVTALFVGGQAVRNGWSKRDKRRKERLRSAGRAVSSPTARPPRLDGQVSDGLDREQASPSPAELSDARFNRLMLSGLLGSSFLIVVAMSLVVLVG